MSKAIRNLEKNLKRPASACTVQAVAPGGGSPEKTRNILRRAAKGTKSTWLTTAFCLNFHNYLVYIVGAVNRMGSLTRWTYFHNGPTVPFNFFYLIHL